MLELKVRRSIVSTREVLPPIFSFLTSELRMQAGLLNGFLVEGWGSIP